MMAEQNSSPGVRVLQEIRDELQDLSAEIREGREFGETRFGAVEAKLTGLTHIVTLLAAHSHEMERRVDRATGGRD